MSRILRKRRLGLLLAGAIALAALWWFGNSMMAGPTSGWKTDFSKSIIDLDQVVSGGVPRDGIPPIDNPRFQPVGSVYHLSDNSPVVAVNVAGDARAYPLEVLTRHEIVNDVVGEIPVAVTFCPLCNSALVYDRRVDGETLRFGVSGNLLNSDLIMWDDLSESWWQQLTGYAIVGEYSGRRLGFVTSQMISFAVFRERYPLGKVLQGPLGAYGRNPYAFYDSSAAPFLFRGALDDRLHPTERVLGAEVAEQPLAYSFPLLRRVRVVNDRVGDIDIVVFWQAGAASALDQTDIDSSRDVGMALMFERRLDSDRNLSFFYDGSGFVDYETGSRWNILGEAYEGPLAGAQLRQTHASTHFWFAWAAFHPDTLLNDDARQPSGR